LVRGPRKSGRVGLTFDDGPHPKHTPRVLDVLNQYGVRATFFVIGKQAEHQPALVRRLAAEGHAVGNHSFSHGEPDQTPAELLMDEVEQTRNLLGSLTGIQTNLFRPPKGKVTARKLWKLWRGGQTVVLWNVDPKDFACESGEELHAWFQRRPLCGGDIVLLHDSLPHAAAILPDLIQRTRAAGLEFATIPEWTI
jgi:peptidoglycan/xylan/chitin deacetylase (PgdA/CDA1 family)